MNPGSRADRRAVDPRRPLDSMNENACVMKSSPRTSQFNTGKTAEGREAHRKIVLAGPEEDRAER